MAKHTPGPWSRRGAGPSSGRDIWAGQVNVGEVYANFTGTDPTLPSPEDAFANARLIVAAPDLLEACELLLKVRLDNGGDEHADAEVRIAKAAIAKAYGQQGVV